jgi:carboxypeptidase C (cathepsin A)
MSSILNYGTQMPGYDFSYIHDLPSYAAIAWYHDKIVPRPPDLPAFLDQVRAFANGPYAQALAAGDALPPAEQAAMAERVAHFTGLTPKYVAASKLRIERSHFRKELLRDDARTLGRYDARAEGIDMDSAGDSPDYDASYSGIIGAFMAALHQHLAQDLHYRSDTEYVLGNGHALAQWSWQHRAWWGERLQLPDTAADLAQAMRENPHLKVLSANGYFDLATPFFATEYDLAHMGLSPAQRANLRVTYYPSGHMIYLNPQALHALKADLSQFYDSATTAPDAR